MNRQEWRESQKVRKDKSAAGRQGHGGNKWYPRMDPYFLEGRLKNEAACKKADIETGQDSYESDKLSRTSIKGIEIIRLRG